MKFMAKLNSRNKFKKKAKNKNLNSKNQRMNQKVSQFLDKINHPVVPHRISHWKRKATPNLHNPSQNPPKRIQSLNPKQ